MHWPRHVYSKLICDLLLRLIPCMNAFMWYMCGMSSILYVMHHIALFKFNIASMKFLFNSFSYCIHKRTVNVKYSQINSFSLLFVKSPDFLSLEKKISRFFTLSGWQVCTLWHRQFNIMPGICLLRSTEKLPPI